MMKLAPALLVSPAFALSMLCALSCGESRHRADSVSSHSSVASTERTAVSRASAKPLPGDGKGDDDYDDVYGSYDNDNSGVVSYGRSAGRTEKQAIVKLVERYYAAAAAADGGLGCALLFSRLAKAIPQEYGRPPGPPGLRGRTCAVVMSKVFRQVHLQVTHDVAVLQVRGVRVEGHHALVLLRFGRLSEERAIAVEREGSVWKVDGLLDRRLA